MHCQRVVLLSCLHNEHNTSLLSIATQILLEPLPSNLFQLLQAPRTHRYNRYYSQVDRSYRPVSTINPPLQTSTYEKPLSQHLGPPCLTPTSKTPSEATQICHNNPRRRQHHLPIQTSHRSTKRTSTKICATSVNQKAKLALSRLTMSRIRIEAGRYLPERRLSSLGFLSLSPFY